MEAALSPDMLATDLAYYLVRKGVSAAGICDVIFFFVLYIFLFTKQIVRELIIDWMGVSKMVLRESTRGRL